MLLNIRMQQVRSELDEILLRHAEECGAKVYEEHKVTELVFAEGSNHRPISARFTTGSGEVHSITFDYLVDASGRAGIMSTKYLKNRHLNETLKNIACWAYFRGADMYAPGTDRENAPWFEALTGKSTSNALVESILMLFSKTRAAGPGLYLCGIRAGAMLFRWGSSWTVK
jgi:hypothetical protein